MRRTTGDALCAHRPRRRASHALITSPRAPWASITTPQTPTTRRSASAAPPPARAATLATTAPSSVCAGASAGASSRARSAASSSSAASAGVQYRARRLAAVAAAGPCVCVCGSAGLQAGAVARARTWCVRRAPRFSDGARHTLAAPPGPHPSFLVHTSPHRRQVKRRSRECDSCTCAHIGPKTGNHCPQQTSSAWRRLPWFALGRRALADQDPTGGRNARLRPGGCGSPVLAGRLGACLGVRHGRCAGPTARGRGVGRGRRSSCKPYSAHHRLPPFGPPTSQTSSAMPPARSTTRGAQRCRARGAPTAPTPARPAGPAPAAQKNARAPRPRLGPCTCACRRC
jgi:hypothetical protein